MTAVTGFRLSPQQAACWRLSQEAATSPYHACLQLQIDRPLDLAVLSSRFQILSAQEEILRTRLQSLPGMQLPIQQIEDSALAELHHEDLCDMPAPMQEQRLREHTALPQFGMALRATVSHIATTRYVLTLSASACHADRRSLRLLASRLLAGLSDGDSLQYADYAEWKNSLLESDLQHPGLAFWRQQQADPLAQPYLGLEAAAGTDAFQPAYAEVPLSSEQSAALAQLADTLHCSMAELLSVGWLVLLSRLSGQASLEVACLDDGRGEGLDDAIGLFEQTVPLRMHIDPAASLRTQWQTWSATYQQALGWRDYNDGGAALDYAFAFHPEAAFPASEGHKLTVLHESCITHRFKLRLECESPRGQLRCRFAYDRHVFSEVAIACVAEQWQLLLRGLAQNNDQPIGGIGLAGEVQRKLIAPLAAMPAIDTADIVTLIERQVQAQPNAPAVGDNDAMLSYEDLNRQANRLARWLVAQGVQAGDIVGILLPRCNDMVVAILAALKAGAAYLPLDPSYPADRLAYMVEDSEVRHVIGYSSLSGLLPRISIPLDHLSDALMALSSENLALSLDPQQPAYLIYTSGSTGQPKAVEISHRNLSHSTQIRIAYYPTPVRAYLLLSSFAFDSSVAGIFWTLVQGGKLVLPANGEELVLDKLGQLIQMHGVSHSLSLPSLYAALLDHVPVQQLASLDTWIVAGEACKTSVVRQHHDKLPQVRLVNEYGPTEATVWATAEVLDTVDNDISIGRPIPTMSLWLLNEHGAPAALGEPGEIHLGGPQLARGYRGKPQQTAEAFIIHPAAANGERIYKTGDLARWGLDGRLRFLGRRDHQVKIRGYRVELSEIERQLLTHGDIGEAVVVAQDHGGDKRLVAYVTGSHGYPPAAGALRDYLAERLPAYMLPSAFVVIDKFPRTPNGKLDLHALPDPDTSAQQRLQYVAPRNDIEAQLAQVCAEVLRLPQVGVLDNFFQIGGDSILSLQVVTRADRRGIRLTAKQIFEQQTIEKIAQVAEWQAVSHYMADIGWMHSVTDQGSNALQLAAERYRMEIDEVIAAVLSRSLLASSGTLRLLRIRAGSGEANADSFQYGTRHAFVCDINEWTSLLQSAKAALRQGADFGDAAPEVSIEVRSSALPQDALYRAQAPLQLTVTVMPHALTLSWSADSRHTTVERLQQVATRFAQHLTALAEHCATASDMGLSAADFPTAGLDQDALANLLSELDELQ